MPAVWVRVITKDQHDVVVVDFADPSLMPVALLRCLGPHLPVAGLQDLGIGMGHFQAADIGADDDQIGQVQLFQVFIHDRGGVKMIGTGMSKKP